MLKKQKINDVTLDKEAISKLTRKQFLRQFDLGNISIEDFLEFIEPPPYFSQVRVFELGQQIRDNPSE